MVDSIPDFKESTDRNVVEDIIQLKRISLGEGAATCQVCGFPLREGNPVVVYVFRPAGEVMFQVGYVVCGGAEHGLPKGYTLGVRELVVVGRVGWCSDAVTQSSWPVLLEPELIAISPLHSEKVYTSDKAHRSPISDDETATYSNTTTEPSKPDQPSSWCDSGGSQ